MSACRTASRPVAVAAVSFLLAVAACTSGTPSAPPAVPSPSSAAGASATPAPTPPASEIPSSGDAATLLLEVTTEGGFINPVATLSSVPSVVVDTDGKIFTPGVPSGDGTIVAPVEVRDVGPAGAAAILAALRSAGLDQQEEGSGIAADTGTTVFTAVIDGEPVVNRFVRSGPGGPGGPHGGCGEGPGGGTTGGGAGGEEPSPACSTPPDPAAAAFDLLAGVTDPGVAWGGSSPSDEPYAPVGYRLYVAPAPSGATGARLAWPLTTPLAGFGRPAVPDFGVPGLRTGVELGADAATLGTAIAAAPPDTLLTSDGDWSVWARPLFPDELGG